MGGEEAFSSSDAAAQDSLQARKQAGRRLRGLTETGEGRTVRAAVRPGGARSLGTVHREHRGLLSGRPDAVAAEAKLGR